MNEEMQNTLLRCLRLVNGLLAITYLAGFAWMVAQIYNMIM
jgi:hypothetical protein